MSFTIEALLGIQPKTVNDEMAVQTQVQNNCSEDEECRGADIDLAGKGIHRPRNFGLFSHRCGK